MFQLRRGRRRGREGQSEPRQIFVSRFLQLSDPELLHDNHLPSTVGNWSTGSRCRWRRAGRRLRHLAGGPLRPQRRDRPTAGQPRLAGREADSSPTRGWTSWSTSRDWSRHRRVSLRIIELQKNHVDSLYFQLKKSSTYQYLKPLLFSRPS